MGRCAAAVLGAVLVLGALAPARAELSWSEFAALRKGVRATAKKPGESSRKHGLLRELQKDDTARAAELLLAWIAESRKLTAKLERKLAVETKKLIRRRSDDRAARETRRKVAALASQLTFERKLLASLTAAAATFRNGDAVKTLLDESRRDVKAASELAAFRRSLFELCKRRRASEVTARLCTFALDEG
ncbi:MAG: hypothetical protein OER88_07850, partial [Planctomycetota bacterium]|nr:hypothetical protein [Planctomycetota bacterium]